MPNPKSNITVRRYQCRHIFTGGRRCGSPSLRNENFCYYHHTTRSPKPPAFHDPFLFPPNETNFVLPHPEDSSAIQHSIGEIINKLANNALDPRRAGLLLYALQIASMNLPKAKPSDNPSHTVEEITLDPVLGPLAPIGEVGSNEPRSCLQDFLDKLDRETEEKEQAKANKTLTLQAAADPSPSTPTRRSRPKCPLGRTLRKSTQGEGTHPSLGSREPVLSR